MRKTGGSKSKKRLAGHGEGGAGGGGPRRGLNRKRAVSMRGGGREAIAERHCLGCAGRVSGVATMGVGRLPPPPGSILALKKCTFSYVVSNLKCFFVRKFLDFEILAPPPRKILLPPPGKFPSYATGPCPLTSQTPK